MNSITLTNEEAMQLWQEDETDSYIAVEKIFSGEWRWGNNYDVVIQDKATSKYYKALIKEQAGDNYHVSWEDLNQVVFYEVEKVEKISYEYKKVK